MPPGGVCEARHGSRSLPRRSPGHVAVLVFAGRPGVSGAAARSVCRNWRRSHAAPTEDDYATIARVAEDCVPPGRNQVLNAFRADRWPLTAAQVVGCSGLTGSLVSYALEDLRLLGLPERAEGAGYTPVPEWLPADEKPARCA